MNRDRHPGSKNCVFRSVEKTSSLTQWVSSTSSVSSSSIISPPCSERKGLRALCAVYYSSTKPVAVAVATASSSSSSSPSDKRIPSPSAAPIRLVSARSAQNYTALVVRFLRPPKPWQVRQPVVVSDREPTGTDLKRKRRKERLETY